MFEVEVFEVTLHVHTHKLIPLYPSFLEIEFCNIFQVYVLNLTFQTQMCTQSCSAECNLICSFSLYPPFSSLPFSSLLLLIFHTLHAHVQVTRAVERLKELKRDFDKLVSQVTSSVVQSPFYPSCYWYCSLSPRAWDTPFLSLLATQVGYITLLLISPFVSR